MNEIQDHNQSHSVIPPGKRWPFVLLARREVAGLSLKGIFNEICNCMDAGCRAAAGRM